MLYPKFRPVANAENCAKIKKGEEPHNGTRPEEAIQREGKSAGDVGGHPRIENGERNLEST
jgi:hypothetical protein